LLSPEKSHTINVIGDVKYLYVKVGVSHMYKPGQAISTSSWTQSEYAEGSTSFYEVKVRQA